MKVYFITAIILVMLITSMGIFGFLSRAHIESNIVVGANSVQIKQIELRENLIRERLTYLYKQEFQLILGVPDGTGGGEALYTVEEGIRLAQEMNLTPPPKTEVKPRDWKKIFWDNVEERNKWMKGQSTFGPDYKKERTR